MRVDIERLDELMNLAGQLAMGKARVGQIGARLKKALSEKSFAQVRDGVGDLFEAMRSARPRERRHSARRNEHADAADRAPCSDVSTA